MLGFDNKLRFSAQKVLASTQIGPKQTTDKTVNAKPAFSWKALALVPVRA